MARPVRTYYKFVDAKGDEARVTIYLPADTTYANVVQFVTDMSAILAPLSGASFRESGFGGIVSTGAIPAEPQSDVQEKAVFSFETSEHFTHRITIPAILEELFLPNSKNLDQGDADVSAFVSALQSGLVVNLTPVYPVDSRGDDLLDLDSAVEEWGKSRKD